MVSLPLKEKNLMSENRFGLVHGYIFVINRTTYQMIYGWAKKKAYANDTDFSLFRRFLFH